MLTVTAGRWLLIAFVLAGLALAVPTVTAHGGDTIGDDTPPYNGTADEWTAWMNAHASEHMGPGAVDSMEAHMGVSIDEMGERMARGGPMTPTGAMTGNDTVSPGGHC